MGRLQDFRITLMEANPEQRDGIPCKSFYKRRKQ